MKKLILASLLLLSQLVFASTSYIRGTILHFFSDPGTLTEQETYQVLDDGLLVVKDGKIEKIGPWYKLKNHIPKHAKIQNYKDELIVPGFVDTHIHYGQVDIIAADNGGHLMTWLKTYIFPNEKQFKKEAYAKDVAHFFVDELLRNGTTTANVFATIYPKAIDALFHAAEQKNMLMITGLVMADRHVPHYLKQRPKTVYKQATKLIKKWHHKKGTRLLFALEPRFAPSTSHHMFDVIKRLIEENPDVYIHTHIAENAETVQWVKNLFNMPRYIDVYDKYNMLGNHTILAHGVYLSPIELDRMASTGSHIAFCPTSNLFLGSGLFDLQRASNADVEVGIGTDIGAGTSFSILRTLNEAYKVQQLNNESLPALRGFYLATLGGAKALGLEKQIGNFEAGKAADIVVLNFKGSTPLLKRRFKHAKNFEEKLFVMMMLGSQKDVLATYVAGKRVYHRQG